MTFPRLLYFSSAGLIFLEEPTGRLLKRLSLKTDGVDGERVLGIVPLVVLRSIRRTFEVVFSLSFELETLTTKY